MKLPKSCARRAGEMGQYRTYRCPQRRSVKEAPQKATQGSRMGSG